MAARNEAGKCQYFYLCRNDAVVTIAHPVLGEVPACQRCADKIARLSATATVNAR